MQLPNIIYDYFLNHELGLNYVWIGLSLLWLAGCAGQQIVQEQATPDIPQGSYASIIKLDNPDGAPERTLAGIVHVTGRATVCTDYPREVIIKSLDDLPAIEREAFANFQHYIIRDAGEIQGYVSLPVGYRSLIWRNENDPPCAYRVQIIPPDHMWRRGEYQGADKSVLSW
jgi:hypothetical protein